MQASSLLPIVGVMHDIRYIFDMTSTTETLSKASAPHEKLILLSVAVHGRKTRGVWRAGEVGKGLRTWDAELKLSRLFDMMPTTGLSTILAILQHPGMCNPSPFQSSFKRWEMRTIVDHAEVSNDNE